LIPVEFSRSLELRLAAAGGLQDELMVAMIQMNLKAMILLLNRLHRHKLWAAPHGPEESEGLPLRPRPP
jgi:hypothetical protein